MVDRITCDIYALVMTNSKELISMLIKDAFKSMRAVASNSWASMCEDGLNPPQ